MTSHRKPRTRILRAATAGRGAAGVTAALASVSLLSHSAAAAPSDRDDAKPSVEEVGQIVDRLHRQAGSATQRYNAAKEETDARRAEVDELLDRIAERTAELNDARRVLGNYAAAQYRTGGLSQTATLLLTEDPQGFFQQTHLLDRMTGVQQKAVEEYEARQREAGVKRSEASRELAALSSSQRTLKSRKHEVQTKLAEARQLLSRLTAQEKARLAEIERQKRAEAARKAAKERDRRDDPSDGEGSGDAYSAKAAKVLAFAERQLGKPYVWGATGPGSYDCSGLTQDAWKAAGISLPRVTYDQVEAGTKIAKSEMRPGDLVFFYDDISHVGIYAGNGRMIHASKPGDDVKYESVEYMPFHSAVRPA